MSSCWTTWFFRDSSSVSRGSGVSAWLWPAWVSWGAAKADAAVAFLPVYDNLERALKQETADEAYKKGVEMTMNQLKSVLEKLGITEIDALGKPFDPALHNAVMHVEDENFGENTVAEVFQAGFMLGEKVIRFAMVKVAN